MDYLKNAEEARLAYGNVLSKVLDSARGIAEAENDFIEQLKLMPTADLLHILEYRHANDHDFMSFLGSQFDYDSMAYSRLLCHGDVMRVIREDIYDTVFAELSMRLRFAKFSRKGADAFTYKGILSRTIEKLKAKGLSFGTMTSDNLSKYVKYPTFLYLVLEIGISYLCGKGNGRGSSHGTFRYLGGELASILPSFKDVIAERVPVTTELNLDSIEDNVYLALFDVLDHSNFEEITSRDDFEVDDDFKSKVKALYEGLCSDFSLWTVISKYKSSVNKKLYIDRHQRWHDYSRIKTCRFCHEPMHLVASDDKFRWWHNDYACYESCKCDCDFTEDDFYKYFPYNDDKKAAYYEDSWRRISLSDMPYDEYLPASELLMWDHNCEYVNGKSVSVADLNEMANFDIKNAKILCRKREAFTFSCDCSSDFRIKDYIVRIQLADLNKSVYDMVENDNVKMLDGSHDIDESSWLFTITGNAAKVFIFKIDGVDEDGNDTGYIVKSYDISSVDEFLDICDSLRDGTFCDDSDEELELADFSEDTVANDAAECEDAGFETVDLDFVSNVDDDDDDSNLD